MNAIGGSAHRCTVFGAPSGRIIIFTCIDIPMFVHVGSTFAVAMTTERLASPANRMFVSLAFRILPALTCAYVPLAFGMPLIRTLDNGYVKSTLSREVHF